jgi:hypothetical protein
MFSTARDLLKKTICKCCVVVVLMPCLLPEKAAAQRDFFQPSPNYNASRVTGIVIGESVLGIATTLWLSYIWYKKFPHSRFHFFNDNAEWLNMDKMGHATTAYNIAAIQTDVLHWAGVKSGTSAAIGTVTALGFMTMIEIMDGHSAEWGFSKGDMLANLSGCFLYAGQQWMWGQQRISLKYSYHHTLFAKYYPEELGKTSSQEWLKDYNGQSYWLSVNIASFLPSNTSFPRWFNVAAGYGAEGMIGAMNNPKEVDGQKIPDFTRYRQFYLSVDADLYRINGLSPFATTLLKVSRTLKVPAPALEWNKVQGFDWHWLYH